MKCEHCGTQTNDRFCSNSCARGFAGSKSKGSKKPRRKNPDVTKTCEFCNIEFTVTWPKRKQRCCSRSCGSRLLSEESRKRISDKMKGVNAGDKNGMFGKTPKNTKRLLVETTKHIGSSKIFVKSTYEKKYIELLEKDKNVKSFKYEPNEFRCKYLKDGKIKTYQPDFLITFSNTQKIVEIKANWTVLSEDTKIKKKAFINTFDIDYEIKSW